jgi:hypothetical protein
MEVGHWKTPVALCAMNVRVNGVSIAFGAKGSVFSIWRVHLQNVVHVLVDGQEKE